MFMSLPRKDCQAANDQKLYKCVTSSCDSTRIVATQCACNHNRNLFTCEQACDGNQIVGGKLSKSSQICSLRHTALLDITKCSYELEFRCNFRVCPRVRGCQLQSHKIEVIQKWVGILRSGVSSLHDVFSCYIIQIRVGWRGKLCNLVFLQHALIARQPRRETAGQCFEQKCSHICCSAVLSGNMCGNMTGIQSYSHSQSLLNFYNLYATVSSGDIDFMFFCYLQWFFKIWMGYNLAMVKKEELCRMVCTSFRSFKHKELTCRISMYPYTLKKIIIL